MITDFAEVLPVALRPARDNDCERIWQYNCSAEARAVSRNGKPVPFAQHLMWYRSRLASSDPMWIIEESLHAVGVVRVDRGTHGARISIALAPHARGRGIGRRAIAAACARMREPLIAEIQDSNATSRHAFEACGFVLAGETDGLATYTWSP